MARIVSMCVWCQENDRSETELRNTNDIIDNDFSQTKYFFILLCAYRLYSTDANTNYENHSSSFFLILFCDTQIMSQMSSFDSSIAFQSQLIFILIFNQKQNNKQTNNTERRGNDFEKLFFDNYVGSISIQLNKLTATDSVAAAHMCCGD